MEKLLMLVLIILSGCEISQTISPAEKKFKKPPETVKKTKCEDIKSLRVFQVLNNFS